MSSPVKILLLGGHGRVAIKLTPLLLAKSWNVTSIIRNPDHEAELQTLAKGKSGKLDVLVESLDDVKSKSDADKVLDKVNPNWVIWAAGAGGKGGASRTYAVDQDAAKHYITASLARPSITKFLMISFIASRASYAPWWTEESRKAADEVKTKVLPDYAKAKVEADEHLLAETEKRRRGGDDKFQVINLRPGTLTDDAGTGKVDIGETQARGNVSREDVAAVAVALLERDDTRGYYDLLEGKDDIATAVEKLSKSGHPTTPPGEDLDRIYKRIK